MASNPSFTPSSSSLALNRISLSPLLSHFIEFWSLQRVSEDAYSWFSRRNSGSAGSHLLSSNRDRFGSKKSVDVGEHEARASVASPLMSSSSSSAIDFLILCHRLKLSLEILHRQMVCLKKKKRRREQASLNKMCKVLGGGLRAEERQELWSEYENNSSLEVNIVKDFDKNKGRSWMNFLSTAGKFQTEIGESWAAEIISRRKSMLSKKLS